jgi:hypothetical protein
MRKKRESYVCIDKQAFLNRETGAYQRLDNTAWYLKKRDGKVGYFINMHTKYQQMPDACFAATAERTPELNVPAVKLQIQKFLEASNESN